MPYILSFSNSGYAEVITEKCRIKKKKLYLGYASLVVGYLMNLWLLYQRTLTSDSLRNVHKPRKLIKRKKNCT